MYAIIAIVNIIISVPLAKKYEGIGSAIGTAISLIIGNGIIINVYYYKKVEINIIKFWKEIIKITISNVIPVAIVLLLMKFIHLKGYSYIILIGMIYTILYGAICYFVSMNEYEKKIVTNLITNIKKIKGR